eukprot:scaffold2466_cov120-Cylindrotheca_fusiformis.AAC.2
MPSQIDSPTPVSMEVSSPTNPPLRIQVVSDLHIEFYGDEMPPQTIIEPKAPILALLGDVGYACTEQLRQFLLAQSDRFEQVLFLAGNHEYYNHGTTYSMTEQNECLQSISAERENLHLMEKDRMIFNDVVVLGTTLWSEIPDERVQAAEAHLNDYHKSYNHAPGETPRLLTAAETREMHRESLAWLESQLEDAKNRNQKVLVLTHHTPLLSGTSDPKYDGNELTSCFSTDLSYLLTSPVEAWACGHTHYNFDLQHCGVRVFSNQRGYKSNPKSSYQSDGIVLEIQG